MVSLAKGSPFRWFFCPLNIASGILWKYACCLAAQAVPDPSWLSLDSKTWNQLSPKGSWCPLVETREPQIWALVMHNENSWWEYWLTELENTCAFLKAAMSLHRILHFGVVCFHMLLFVQYVVLSATNTPYNSGNNSGNNILWSHYHSPPPKINILL